MDELELLRAATANVNAFVELYHRYVTRVYRYHMAHVGSAPAAEDLTSQTFMAALDEFHSFRGRGSFAAWLLEIAAKKRRNDSRGSRRELPVDAVLYYQSSALPTDGFSMLRKEMEANTRALKQISSNHAEAVILTFFGELSNPEVSRILKKSTATTRALISHGLQELRTHSTLARDERTTADQETLNSDSEYERLAAKLTHNAGQIIPDPHFMAELEKTLVINYLPKTKLTFSLQQIVSLVGWALFIAMGVFLLYWRATPNPAAIKPIITHASNPDSTMATEIVIEVTSGRSTTVRTTVTTPPTLEYIVQAGDTCTYIADRFGVTIDQLITFNDLNDSCDIWIDQQLFIPITPTSTP